MKNKKNLRAIALLVVLVIAFTQTINVSAAVKKTVAAKSVTVSSKTVTVTIGKTITIKATVKPANVTKKGVTYSSSNTKIATVSKAGTVTAKAAGNVSITVKSADGKAKVTVKVTVQDLSNVEKAKAVINSFATGDSKPITNYVSKTGYIQHNLAFADGRQTMLNALPALKKAGTTVKTVRSFSDGNYVVLQSEYNLFGAGKQVGFDVFRFEKGVIVEHWDNLINLQKANPSGHTQLDGTTKVTDLNKTNANKQLVSNFVNDVLVGVNPGNLTKYFNGDNYIQHNPNIADGLSGLGAALADMQKNGIEMVYNQVHMVLGEGNFVLAVSEGTFAGKATSYYDLFRVENGKIAEHWDVMETIAPVSEWKNSNGKFEKTVDVNKAKAVAVIESLASGEPQAINDYVSDSYIQHNLAFKDGKQFMLDSLSALKAAGTTVEIKRVIAEGDYVVLQSKYNLFGAGEQVGFDVFRFKDGKIVEHWDNLAALTKANPSGHTQLDGLFQVTDITKTAANKKLVQSFVKDVLMGKNPNNLQSYFDGDNYIQHNSDIADGLSGLGAALDNMAQNGISMVYDKTHIVVAQGNYVLTVSEGTFAGKATSYYDLFRVENGKIAEHWDVIETIADKADWQNNNGKY